MKVNYIFLLLTVVFMACSCKQSSCMSYSEAIKKDMAEGKATIFIIEKDTLELEYVRDQVYNDTIPFCYGNLDMKKENFKKVTKQILKDYNIDNVRAVSFFCEGKDICNGDIVSIDDARYLYIAYIDNENYGIIDFVDLKTGKKQTHRVCDFYASVSIYNLMEKTNIKNYPSNVSIYNNGIDKERIMKINFVSKRNDKMWQEAHN